MCTLYFRSFDYHVRRGRARGFWRTMGLQTGPHDGNCNHHGNDRYRPSFSADSIVLIWGSHGGAGVAVASRAGRVAVSRGPEVLQAVGSDPEASGAATDRVAIASSRSTHPKTHGC